MSSSTPQATNALSSPKSTPFNIDEELNAYSVMVRTDVFPSWEKTLIGSDGVARKVYSVGQLCDNNTKEQVIDTILRDQGSFSSENQEFTREFVYSPLFDLDNYNIHILTTAFTHSTSKASTTKKFILALADKLKCSILNNVQFKTFTLEGVEEVKPISRNDLFDDNFMPLSPFLMYSSLNLIVNALALILLDKKDTEITQSSMELLYGKLIASDDLKKLFFDDAKKLRALLVTKKQTCFTLSFESKMIGPNKDEHRLMRYIQDVDSQAKDQKFYSKMITICQSSGYGKTKLSCQMSHHFPVAYCVFRGSGEDALTYPNETNVTEAFKDCFQGFGKVLFNVSAETVIARHLCLIESILKEINRLEIEKDMPEICSMFVSGKVVPHPTELTSIDEHIANIDMLLSNKKLSPTVFVFDEVINLIDKKLPIDHFRLLRRTFNYLRKSNIVFLVLGTSSDFLDLNPSISVDSMRDPGFDQTPPPFIVTSNFDIFQSKYFNAQVTQEMLRNQGMVYSLISMGRPLWSSTSVDKVFTLAIAKLCNNSLLNGNTYAASWMIRTGIVANPYNMVLARNLVKSLMGTLVYVSEDSGCMNVAYPSEPCVAIAARSIVTSDLETHFKEFKNLIQHQSIDSGRVCEPISMEFVLLAITKANGIKLDDYDESIVPVKKPFNYLLEEYIPDAFKNYPLEESKISCGTFIAFEVENVAEENAESEEKVAAGVDSSKGAETVQRRATSVKNFRSIYINHVITVKDFLVSMYGSDYVSRVSPKIDFSIMEAYINATHFTSLNGQHHKTANQVSSGVITDRLLTFGLLRQCGFCMPPGYIGIDFIIPICLKNGGLSYISVQVTTNMLDIVECVEKMRIFDHQSKNYHNKHLSIVLNMRTTRSTIFKGPDESKSFDSDWFDSVVVEKFKHTSNGLSFCTAVVKNKEGGMVDKDKDDDVVLNCIRSTNVFHFKHLWNSEKKVSDIICTIVDSDYEFLSLSKERYKLKSFIKDQTENFYEMSPSYVDNNQFLTKKYAIAKLAASIRKRKPNPRNQ